MRSRHRPAPPSVDDEVRSSLDVLDRVIGEFDDGLLSSAESEVQSRRQSRLDLRSASSEPEEKEEKIRPEIRGSRLSINEQIDDIFSELTEEIYNEDKVDKSDKRRIFDPLPSPPNTRTHPPPIDRKKKPGKRQEKHEQKSQTMDADRPRPGTVLAAKKSFMERKNEDAVLYTSHGGVASRREQIRVEVHNSSRDSVSPPPKPEKHKIHLKHGSAERGRNSRERTRSNGRRRDGSRGWEQGRDRSRGGGRETEKNMSSREAAMIQELKEKVSDSKGKISKFSSNRRSADAHQRRDEFTRKANDVRRSRSNAAAVEADEAGGVFDENTCPNIPLPPPPPSSLAVKRADGQKVGQTQVNRGGGTKHREENRGERSVELTSKETSSSSSRRENRKDREYKRSKSLGPLVPRSDSPDLQGSRRSRSRGPRRNHVDDEDDFDHDLRGRSRSRGRVHRPESRSLYPGDGSARRSMSRGRSPSRPSEFDRSGKRSREGGRREFSLSREGGRREFSPSREGGRREFSPGREGGRREFSPGREGGRREYSPPSPAEAQATLEKMLPRIPHGVPPTRQRSMVDLRVTEDLKRRNRRSMAAGPMDDFPMHMRNQVNVQRNLGVRPDYPAYIEEQMRLQHHLNIDAQRELLIRRGFPQSHPLVSGEIPIHPELLGHLHFDVPSRTTLPLGPDDYRRFLPEMQRSGMQSAFPLSTSDLIALQQETEKINKVKRQKSHKETSFSSLQYEDMKKKKGQQSRSQSTDARERKFRPFSMFSSGGGGWFSSSSALKDGADRKNKAEAKQHWYMKERNEMQSLPPLGTLADSGLGDDLGHHGHISRGDKNRSSFGMILKDKFQKNPNMYFPDTHVVSKSPEHKNQKPGKGEELSDTDTLIHNMSEGSFDKDSSLSGRRSVGSSKSNESSGKSSLSHDSINGTPEMKRRSESITTPKTPNNTAVHLASNPSVILNKKTIRNYTPKESSNMLRQFEEGRHSSMDNRKGQHRKSSSVEPDKGIQRKSSMDRLIEDFHRNLPPPPAKDADSVSPFSDVDSMFSGSNLLPQLLPEQNFTHKSSKTGTVTSQTSNWSVASSAASFDYHMVSGADKKSAKLSHKSKDSASRKRMSQSTTNLPALSEADYSSRDDLSPREERISREDRIPREERIPPEGAAADSPKQFVQRIEVNREPERSTHSTDRKTKPPRKSGKEAAKEEVKDLLEPSKNGDDELVMLKKLISEGRISGLNEKPPSFKPPTPPAKNASGVKKAKAPVPKPTQNTPKTPEVSKTPSGDRPRKSREAPPPPDKLKPPPETAEIKFISGRRIHSVEDLQSDEDKEVRGDREGRREQKSDQVQRSTSMHMPRDYRSENDAVAKLIADSTEKKFKINNIFKGMWKKKHYSFDLS